MQDVKPRVVDFTFLKGDVMREPSGHVQLSEVSSRPRSLNETILALNQLADNDNPYNSKHAHHGNLHSDTLHLCSASC